MHPHFFGYGSLVNTDTHDYAPYIPARLSGWRRVWRHTPLRPVAFLTAEPCDGVDIDGLIAPVPNADWAALDEREFAYERVDVTGLTAHEGPGGVEIATYSIPDGKHGAPDGQHPILLSYLDVVVQGYLRVFGPEGAAHFFDTTIGWDGPVLDDRDAPRYPRAQTLSQGETAIVDVALDRLGVTKKATT